MNAEAFYVSIDNGSVKLTRDKALRLIYRWTHRDSKGRLPDGTMTVLTYRNGTCLVALRDLTDDEIKANLPRAFRLDCERKIKAALAAKAAA